MNSFYLTLESTQRLMGGRKGIRLYLALFDRGRKCDLDQRQKEKFSRIIEV